MTDFIDTYDELIGNTNQVAECLLNALTDTDKSSSCQEIAKLIQQCEKTRSDSAAEEMIFTKIALLVISSTVDDIQKEAKKLVDLGDC